MELQAIYGERLALVPLGRRKISRFFTFLSPKYQYRFDGAGYRLDFKPADEVESRFFVDSQGEMVARKRQ